MYAVNNVLGLSLEEIATFDKILEGSLALAMEDSKTSSIGQLKKMFETFADYVDIDQRLADRISISRSPSLIKTKTIWRSLAGT